MVKKQPRSVKAKSKGKKGLRNSLGTKPRSKPKRRLQARTQMHPYLRCIMGPPSMAGSGQGFPDGTSAPAVTVDYRQTLTMTPVGGVIKFALVSSPYGTLAIQNGTVNTSRPAYTGTTDLGYNWLVGGSQTITGATGTPYYVIANNEVQSAQSAPSANPFGPYSTTRYRGLMYTADVYFTGSTMQNGGVSKVYRTTVAGNTLPQVNVNTVPCEYVEYTNIESGIGGATGTVVSPARVSLNLRAVSPKPEYIPVEENFMSSNIVAFGRTQAGATTGFVWTGLDVSVPVTVVEYSGLDASASITIEMRSCLEQIVAPGVLSGLAKPSPMSDLSIWQKAANFARSVPAARVITGAASGYLTGGGIGALTGALSAMQV